MKLMVETDSGSGKKKGGRAAKIKQLRIELDKEEAARVNLTRNAPDKKS